MAVFQESNHVLAPVPDELAGSSSKISCSCNSIQQMLALGCCRIHGYEFDLPDCLWEDFNVLKRHFNNLPKDPYGPNANRYRQLRRYTLLPFDRNHLASRPDDASVYEASSALNPEVGGIVRRFQPIPDRLTQSQLVKGLVLFDFENSQFSESARSGPIDVGVHMIRLMAEPNKPGISVPDCLHKDGEPFTWIHLVNRIDVVGGVNVVTDNAKKTLIETTLEQPMDTIGVADERVYHQVKRINVRDGALKGYRDVILVDLTPMVANPSRTPA